MSSPAFDLGLISVRERGRDLAFYPTLSARAATKDVPGYLDRLASEARDENERSRCHGGPSVYAPETSPSARWPGRAER